MLCKHLCLLVCFQNHWTSVPLDFAVIVLMFGLCSLCSLSVMPSWQMGETKICEADFLVKAQVQYTVILHSCGKSSPFNPTSIEAVSLKGETQRLFCCICPQILYHLFVGRTFQYSQDLTNCLIQRMGWSCALAAFVSWRLSGEPDTDSWNFFHFLCGDTNSNVEW